MRVLKIITDTIVDGPGFRTSVYLAGCNHMCKGCHNRGSWDFAGGTEMSQEEVYSVIMANEGGVTFSGGDPMYQATSLAPLLRRLKEAGKDIWIYTGFTYEELIGGMESMMVLHFTDVLVDGPFLEDKKDDTLIFRGSSNQRIIDVKKSLEFGKVIELDLDYNPKFD